MKGAQMHQGERFDRRLKLAEIFSQNDLERIGRALSLALGGPVTLVDANIPGKPGWQRVDILWELEPIACLESPQVPFDQLKGGAGMVQLLLREAVRYRMASELHLETVLADFETLQEKHAQLQRSEARYRELSEQLEEKVAAQVKEIKEAERKLFLSEKMASVGQLAAGMAHELNTPLAYIRNNLAAAQGYLQDLEPFFATLESGGDPEAVRRSWQEQEVDYIREDFPVLVGSCLEGVTRLASIVSDLKVFANINQVQQSLDDVNARLITVLNMLKPQISDQVEIVRDFAELPAIPCYPAHLGQLFYNLIQNGVQAIEGKGRVVIRTFAHNGHLCVAVTDTGTGIGEQDIARIFDPFFTTKEVGKGTGLGLSVVHDVVKAHQGRIEVASRPGAGSTFTVFLPMETGSAQAG